MTDPYTVKVKNNNPLPQLLKRKLSSSQTEFPSQVQPQHVKAVLFHNRWMQSVFIVPKPPKGLGRGVGGEWVREREGNQSYHTGKSIIQH